MRARHDTPDQVKARLMAFSEPLIEVYLLKCRVMCAALARCLGNRGNDEEQKYEARRHLTVYWRGSSCRHGWDEVRSRRRAMVSSSFGRTFGRVHGQTAMQIPHDANSVK